MEFCLLVQPVAMPYSLAPPGYLLFMVPTSHRKRAILSLNHGPSQVFLEAILTSVPAPEGSLLLTKFCSSASSFMFCVCHGLLPFHSPLPPPESDEPPNPPSRPQVRQHNLHQRFNIRSRQIVSKFSRVRLETEFPQK